jgi:hypothetical protein
MEPRRIVEHALPERRVVSSDPVGRGNRKTTTSIECAEQRPVMVQTATDIDALRSEAAVTAAIDSATTVPVPTVLGGGVIDGTAYLLTEQVPGENLHERFAGLPAADRSAIARSFGRFLGEIHDASRFEGCGDVRPTGERWDSEEWPVGATPPRLDVSAAVDPEPWLVAYGTAAVERLPPAFDPVARRLRTRLREPPVAADGGEQRTQPVLFPWDLRPGNALHDERGITAVLDWEAPLSAPAALAVAKTEYLVADWYVDSPAAEREAFRAGYETVRPYPTISPVTRAVAIATSAVDSTGAVTNPGYPELDREAAIEFHREALANCL